MGGTISGGICRRGSRGSVDGGLRRRGNVGEGDVELGVEGRSSVQFDGSLERVIICIAAEISSSIRCWDNGAGISTFSFEVLMVDINSSGGRRY